MCLLACIYAGVAVSDDGVSRMWLLHVCEKLTVLPPWARDGIVLMHAVRTERELAAVVLVGVRALCMMADLSSRCARTVLRVLRGSGRCSADRVTRVGAAW